LIESPFFQTADKERHRDDAILLWLKVIKEIKDKRLNDCRQHWQRPSICHVFQAMEEMTDRGLIANNCPRHGVHRRLPKTRTAKMISATAVRKFTATAGTKGRLQIMNQRMTISADCLPLPDKSNLTE